jgi:hypothetical protein
MAAEAQLEKRAAAEAKKLDILFWKFSSPARRGVPDRVLVGPTGKVGFIEFKAPGKKPSSLQQYYLDSLQSRGIVAGYADNIQSAITLIKQLL